MALSRQVPSLRSGGRTNQKARTRTALLQAAAELIEDGRAPSMPEAADRALVSVATAYRYFSSSEDLWWEAANMAIGLEGIVTEADRGLDAAGDDPQARVEALVRTIGFHMLDEQLPYRQIAKTAMEQWFRQADAPDSQRVPIRQGRRNEQIRKAITPLRDRLAKKDVDRVANALGIIIGTEAMIALTDAVGLDVAAAKKTLLDAGRWLLTGALAELTGVEN